MFRGHRAGLCDMKTHLDVGVEEHVIGSIWNLAYDVST
jgi:hypothetical protein